VLSDWIDSLTDSGTRTPVFPKLEVINLQINREQTTRDTEEDAGTPAAIVSLIKKAVDLCGPSLHTLGIQAVFILTSARALVSALQLFPKLKNLVICGDLVGYRNSKKSYALDLAVECLALCKIRFNSLPPGFYKQPSVDIVRIDIGFDNDDNSVYIADEVDETSRFEQSYRPDALMAF
jgi:hypothetical protein